MIFAFSLFAFLCVLCVLCGSIADSTRDLSCPCGRRTMPKVVCDAERARTIADLLAKNCPWCRQDTSGQKPETGTPRPNPSPGVHAGREGVDAHA